MAACEQTIHADPESLRLVRRWQPEIQRRRASGDRLVDLIVDVADSAEAEPLYARPVMAVGVLCYLFGIGLGAAKGVAASLMRPRHPDFRKRIQDDLDWDARR